MFFGLPTPHDTSLRAANLRSGRDESVLLSLPRWMSNSSTGLNLVHPGHLTSHDIFVHGDHLTFLTPSLIRSQEREVGPRLCTTPVHAFPLTKLQVIVTIHSNNHIMGATFFNFISRKAFQPRRGGGSTLMMVQAPLWPLQGTPLLPFPSQTYPSLMLLLASVQLTAPQVSELSLEFSW